LISKQSFLIIGFVAGMILGAIIGAHEQGKADRTTVIAATRIRPGHNDGQMAPDFQLSSLDGRQVKLSSYRGKAVLLNFWASWCGPCKVEMPWFAELQQRYHQQGLEVIGVSVDNEGKDKIAAFVKEMHANYTILLGTDEVSDAYGGIQGLPTSFYIDRNGKIVNQVAGLISEDEIEDNVKKALQLTVQSTAAAPSAAERVRAQLQQSGISAR
jgi:peroxiredoxin